MILVKGFKATMVYYETPRVEYRQACVDLEFKATRCGLFMENVPQLCNILDWSVHECRLGCEVAWDQHL